MGNLCSAPKVKEDERSEPSSEGSPSPRSPFTAPAAAAHPPRSTAALQGGPHPSLQKGPSQLPPPISSSKGTNGAAGPPKGKVKAPAPASPPRTATAPRNQTISYIATADQPAPSALDAPYTATHVHLGFSPKKELHCPQEQPNQAQAQAQGSGNPSRSRTRRRDRDRYPPGDPSANEGYRGGTPSDGQPSSLEGQSEERDQAGLSDSNARLEGDRASLALAAPSIAGAAGSSRPPRKLSKMRSLREALEKVEKGGPGPGRVDQGVGGTGGGREGKGSGRRRRRGGDEETEPVLEALE